MYGVYVHNFTDFLISFLLCSTKS